MVTLLTIQHDPDGRLLKPLQKALPLLDDLFLYHFLVKTPGTHQDYKRVLRFWNKEVFPQTGMADARRDVVNLALHMKSNHYFYCDLDRLVHWAITEPDELRETISQTQNKDYTVVGRKHMAMQSHPLFQLKTEEIMNMSVKEKVGLDMDVFAGARMISYQAAKWISEQSVADHAAQDIEWPKIVFDNGGELGYIEVDGLSYESTALDIRHSKEDEINLRMTNLKSVLEYLE